MGVAALNSKRKEGVFSVKSFAEFRNSLTEEDWNSILLRGINAFEENGKVKQSDIVNICLMNAVALLEHYHEWLIEELDKSCDRQP